MKLKEAYIRTDKGNIYYTKRGETLISLSKTIFLEKGLPVRVYYDINKDLYVFGNANNFIHADLANYMKYHSNTYGADEMRANVSYLMKNCALFQILPDDDFKKYDIGDGYKSGWVLFANDMIFACRNKEYEKVRDKVPLFKDYIGYWAGVEFYEYKKSQKLNESVEYIEGVEVLINPSKQELNGFMKKNKVYRVLLTDNDMAIWTADCPLCHLDVEGEYPEFNNSEHLFALNGNLFFVDYDMKPEEIEDFYFEDAEKLDNLPIVKDYFPHSQMKKALEMMKNGISAFNVPNDWHGWLNESAEDKILYLVRGLPGSGKSTLAKTLTKNVVEADQFLYDDEGKYVWTQERVYKAHKQCQATVRKYMEEGRNKIAVANCFVKLRDMKPYKKLAEEFGYKVIIKVCKGNYGSIHNVSDETMNRMKNNFQLDESVKYLNKEYSDTKIITSNYDMKKYLNNYKNLRIVYDKLNKWYFVNDSEKAVHFNIMSDAIKAGFYNDYKVNSGIDLLLSNYYEQFVVFVVNDGSVPADAFEADDYFFEYKYDTFNIYDRDGQFIDCPLYQILGIPNETNRIDGYNEIVENENNINYYFIGKCNDTDDGMEIQEITHWDEWGNSEYYGIPEDDESIEVIDTNAFIKMIGNQPKPEKIEYCAKNKDKDIIWAYDDEGIHWFYSQSGDELFESAENDKTLRDYAVKLTNIVIDSIIEPKYKTTLTTNSLEINVDKAFKKAVPILKKSPLTYYVVLCSYEDEKHANYGISTDGKYGLITLPILPDNPVKILTNLLSKHRKYLDKLSQQYTGKEFMDKVNESAIRWLKQILKKSSDFYRNNYMDVLTHECTHAIDGVRRTNTFKHRKQDLETEKGIKKYYNSSIEQNAYYQETIALFDKWAEESVRYKKFDHFMDDFKRQYRGEWNLLNNINKRKIMRRAYAYWELYMKD